MKEHFRGVVWPRGEQNGLHRYVIVGMIVTDKPLENLIENQIVLDGHAAGMSDALSTILQKESNFQGDANTFLTEMEYL